MVKPYCRESISETIFEKNPQSPALPNFQHNALEFAAKQVIDRCVALQGNNDHQGAILISSYAGTVYSCSAVPESDMQLFKELEASILTTHHALNIRRISGSSLPLRQ